MHGQHGFDAMLGVPMLVRAGYRLRAYLVAVRLYIAEDGLQTDPTECGDAGRGGVCGQCKTAVLEGDIEHRDAFLDDQEKASQRCIMPCVSRSASDYLVLDL